MKLEYNISPKFMMVFNAIVAGLGVLMQAGAQFTDLFGQGPSQKIIAAVSLAFMFLGAIGTAMGAGSSTHPGPLATPDK